MPHSHDLFFPSRPKREYLAYVDSTFPFPLAITYLRLQEEMDRQEPIAAAWQLRDAFECLLKFVASLAVADLLQSEIDPHTAAEVVAMLLKPQGLTLGDWHTLLEKAAAPLMTFASENRLATPQYCLPELYEVFFMRNGKRSRLNRQVMDGDKSFVNWRNRVFGHGVFKQERQWYADETLRWMPVLHELCSALHPLFEKWTLVSRTHGGEEIDWHGAGELAPVARHQHEPIGEPLPMFLSQHSDVGRGPLRLGALLSVQQCAHCHQPAAFFFDRNKYDRHKDRHRTFFLEYFRGHNNERGDWDEARKLATLLPSHFQWERTSYDGAGFDESQGIVFRDFDTQYLRPDYLMDAFWSITDTRSKGYVYLVGPSGVGKTYFVRGVEADGRERGIPVLRYHITGASTDYRTFIHELGRIADNRLRFRTQEVQTGVGTLAELQTQFLAFVRELMRANRLDTLIIAIDALEELHDPGADLATITDFLPPSEQLPKGCFVLLTSRKLLADRIRGDIHRISESSTDFLSLEISPSATENRQLLQRYLQDRLPKRFRNESAVNAVLDRSGGVFLYALHFCRALEAGAFSDVNALPDGHDFYAAYLNALRLRVGDSLFETVYLPILVLLCAAQQPVSAEQLARWGVSADKLRFALYDLNDFLRCHRVCSWHDSLQQLSGQPRYELAHEAFTRFVHEDQELSTRLKDAHKLIGCHALATHAEHWDDIDPFDVADLYDLRFVATHLRAAGLAGEEDSLCTDCDKDGSYLWNCIQAAETATNNGRYIIALDLYTRVIEGIQHCPGNDALGREKEYNGILVPALAGKAQALTHVWRLSEALSLYGKAIESWPHHLTDKNLTIHFAGLWSGKGSVLHHLDRSQESVESYQQAVDIYRRLIQERCDPVERGRLAHVLISLRNPLLDLGRYAEARDDLDEAVRLCQGLAEEGLDVDELLTDALAGLGHITGKLYCSEASRDLYRQALATFSARRPTTRSSRNATWALGRAQLLEHNTQYDDAASYYEDAAVLLKSCVDKGQTEELPELARALWLRSECLLVARRLSEALTCAQESVDIYQRLIKKDGLDHLADSLTNVLDVEGQIFQDLRKYPDALRCYDEAIALCHCMISNGNRRCGLVSLIGKLMFKRDLFFEWKRYVEASNCGDEIIRVVRDLMCDDYASSWSSVLAHALDNKADALNALGKTEEKLRCRAEALTYYDAAIEEWTRLIERVGHLDITERLSTLLSEKAKCLQETGQLSEALEHQSVAEDKLRQLVASIGGPRLTALLADAIVQKADLLCKCDHLDDALTCHGEVIRIYQDLIESQKMVELTPNLARVIAFKGETLHCLHRYKEALDCYTEAAELLRDLLAEEKEVELVGTLAHTLAVASNASSDLSDDRAAATLSAEAVGLYRWLVDEQALSQCTRDFIQTLMNCGVYLDSLGQQTEALVHFDEALQHCRRLFDASEDTETLDDLALTLGNQGEALHKLRRTPEEMESYTEAIAAYERIVAKAEEPPLVWGMALVMMNKGRLHEELNEWDHAMTCYDDALDAWIRLLAKKEDRVLQHLLVVLAGRFRLFQRGGDWVSAAADMQRAIDFASPALQSDVVPEPVRDAVAGLLTEVRELSVEARSHLYDLLGEKPAKFVQEHLSRITAVPQIPEGDTLDL